MLNFLLAHWQEIALGGSYVLHLFPKKTVAYKAGDIIDTVRQ